jgi:CHAT domain-containing protein/Tfp pilus assembly protein PilF
VSLPDSRIVRLLLVAGATVLGAVALAGCRQDDDAGRARPAAAALEPASRRVATVDRELKPGKTEVGRLSGPSPGAYRVALGAGEYLHVVVEQRGMDAVAVLLDPGGRALLALDSPTGDRGPEEIFFVAETGGSYLLEVRPFGSGNGGGYEVWTERRRATERDRGRAAACRAVSEADAAGARGDVGARSASRRRYGEAIEQWRRAGEVYQEALTEMKLGKALSIVGEVSASVQHLERALTLDERLRIANQQPVLHNELGLAEERLGALDRARSSFEAAERSARTLGNRHEETAAINNLGLLEESAGEPWKALVLLDEALAGWRESGERVGEAATLHNLGTLYTVLGKLQEAREVLEPALGLYRAAGRRRDEAATLMALGWVRFREGDPTGARADLRRALALRRNTGDRRGEAVTLDRLGTVSCETGELDRALSEYRQALAILEEVRDPRGRALTLSNLGEALTLQGNPAAGLRSQAEALALLADAGEPSAEAYALFRRARAERSQGALEPAWADMQKAIPRLEEIRERAQSDDFRMTYFESVHEQYEFAVDVLMELQARKPGAGFDHQALDMAERARARGLLDLVHEARGRQAAEQLDPQSGRLHRLEEELRAAEKRQAERVSPEGEEGAVGAEEAEIRRLLTEREKMLVELRLAGSTKSFSAKPLGLDEIQRHLLDPETVLLIYALGETRSFLWTLSDREVESAVLPPRAQIERAAERFHSLLARSERRGTAKQLELTAAELSKVLLLPAGHRLEGKRIVVVPDGALAYVPFGALPEPTTGGQPLLVRHEVVLLPSASVLAAIRERAATRRPAPKVLAVVADPVFGVDDPRLAGARKTDGSVIAGRSEQLNEAFTRSTQDLGLRGLGRLPFSHQEADAILALVPPDARFGASGFAANLALLTGGRLGSFRYLHFATHALIHPRYPELSGVVLSLFDEGGRPQAGFLRSYQIFGLHLPADLVVLSACKTGLGQKVNGEGLVGLTQSFFHAGASRVAVSLWDVDDRATASLMERFYREILVGGRSPAAALRQAQLAMRGDSRWAAPYYWAGFVLEGDWR